MKGRLKAIDHTFEKVSVGATENILMAAALAEGVSILRNAALEPEIGDLGQLLQAMGAQIEGLRTGTLTVTGVARLHGCEHADSSPGPIPGSASRNSVSLP